MSKTDLSKIAINDENSMFSTDFIKQNTKFDTPTEFCHALGIFTLEDLDKICRIPNIDEMISKYTNFKTLDDFYKAQLPKYMQDIL